MLGSAESCIVDIVVGGSQEIVCDMNVVIFSLILALRAAVSCGCNSVLPNMQTKYLHTMQQSG